MCGVVGFFGSGDTALLRRLTDCLQHRGPDSEGFFVDEQSRVYIGHRRLAVRDLSGGEQPMVLQQQRYVLSYNGELYNDLDLRRRLENLGHVFSTQSDTEVVLRSIIQWGEDAFGFLDGMFALCFVDNVERIAILARDRFGEKPLFWTSCIDSVVFASESSVVARHSSLSPELDEDNCARFLLMGYLPPPHSIIKNIFQVEPGQLVRIDLNNLQDVALTKFARPWDHMNTPIEALKDANLNVHLIDEAVKSRRISDVPVGILLSGGVDSSLILNSAVRLGWRPDTFTIGLSQTSFDESEYASQFAESSGVRNFQSRIVPPSSTQISQVLATLDEPLGDSSYFPTYKVFELAKSHLKVVLTGDGGDELFFGYEPFRVLGLAKFARRVIRPRFAKSLSAMISRIPRTESYMNRVDVAERFFDGLQFDSVLKVKIWMSTLRTSAWKKFLHTDCNILELLQGSSEDDTSSTEEEAVRRFFLSSYLPGSVLSKSDCASMAHGVESRTVFFFPPLANLALKNQAKTEIRRGLGKQSLRNVLRSEGFADVASRRKHGFGFPIASALRNMPSSAPQLALRCINQSSLDEEWARMKQGKRANHHFLWSALSLEHCRAYKSVIQATNTRQ